MTSAWRSRDFVLPLVVTLGGTAVSYWFASSATDDCRGSACAYLVSAIIVQWLALFLPGLVATGVLVGLISRQTHLALRGIAAGLVALGILAIIIGSGPYIGRENGPDAFGFLIGLVFLSTLLLGILLAPLGLGFALGRAIRRHVRSSAP